MSPSGITVEVDARAATAMLDGMAERASAKQLQAAIERVARDAMGRISSVPRGATGALQGGFDLRARGDAIVIVNTAPYARFVFRGTRHMDARPPDVHADQIARELAQAITREVVG